VPRGEVQQYTGVCSSLRASASSEGARPDGAGAKRKNEWSSRASNRNRWGAEETLVLNLPLPIAWRRPSQLH